MSTARFILCNCLLRQATFLTILRGPPNIQPCHVLCFSLCKLYLSFCIDACSNGSLIKILLYFQHWRIYIQNFPAYAPLRDLRFHIHFHREVATLEVHAPPPPTKRVHAPPTRNPGFAPVLYTNCLSVFNRPLDILKYQQYF